MLDAIAEAVAEEGYPRTTVAHVIDRAGVSRKTFYEHFSDRQECFLAAFDAAVSAVLEAIAEAVATSNQPLEAAKVATRRYLEWLAANPSWARTFVIEVLAAGPEALECRLAMRERFAEMIAAIYESLRRQAGDLPPRPAHVFRACVGAIDELVTDHLVRHGADDLLTLVEPVLDVVLGLLLGPVPPPEGW